MRAVKTNDENGLYEVEMTQCAKHRRHNNLHFDVRLDCLGMFSFHQNVIKALNARQQHELCEPELILYSNKVFCSKTL